MYRAPKGVFDILPDDPESWKSSYLWQYLEGVIRGLATRYGYREIRTPLFESTDLFTRSIGEGTDIVTKEMYTFNDKGDRSLTLRPEGTASALRAFIEHHLNERGGLQKLFYIGPMFRYERQQAGRYRQHHQFGVEAIGTPSPCLDAEVIDLLFSLLSQLGLKELSLQINSIGTPETRKTYVAELKSFLSAKRTQLSEDSQRRFDTNPLRILDSKDLGDQQLLQSAPSILDFLSDHSKHHFEQVLALLDQRNIPYQINPSLVRGLDYYNDTVFEVVSKDLGGQNSLGGGGRYDRLLSQLGGPDLPACGFGSGLERILQTLIKQGVALPQKPVPELLFIPMDEAATVAIFPLAARLRDRGVACELELSGRRLKTILKQANEQNIPYITVIGEEELAKKMVELKEMVSGATESLTFDALEARFSRCTT